MLESRDPARSDVLRGHVASAVRGARDGAAGAGEALTEAVASLFDQAVDRILAAPYRVRSAAEGKASLASEESTEAMTDRVQKVVLLTIPVLRTLAKGARFTRVPWVLVASTAVSIGIAVRTGVREVQVLGSLIAHRLEEATGRPADPALVKKLTVDLYLSPGRTPDLADRRLRIARLARRWLFRGAFGRETRKSAMSALDAAERLDMSMVGAEWASSPARIEGEAQSTGRRASP